MCIEILDFVIALISSTQTNQYHGTDNNRKHNAQTLKHLYIFGGTQVHIQNFSSFVWLYLFLHEYLTVLFFNGFALQHVLRLWNEIEVPNLKQKAK